MIIYSEGYDMHELGVLCSDGEFLLARYLI